MARNENYPPRILARKTIHYDCLVSIYQNFSARDPWLARFRNFCVGCLSDGAS
jgi:hypothetical protein